MTRRRGFAILVGLCLGTALLYFAHLVLPEVDIDIKIAALALILTIVGTLADANWNVQKPDPVLVDKKPIIPRALLAFGITLILFIVLAVVLHQLEDVLPPWLRSGLIYASIAIALLVHFFVRTRIKRKQPNKEH